MLVCTSVLPCTPQKRRALYLHTPQHLVVGGQTPTPGYRNKNTNGGIHHTATEVRYKIETINKKIFFESLIRLIDIILLLIKNTATNISFICLIFPFNGKLQNFPRLGGQKDLAKEFVELTANKSQKC